MNSVAAAVAAAAAADGGKDSGGASNVKWNDEQERYLTDVMTLSKELSQRYNVCYHVYKRAQNRVRLPIVTISSVSGLLSFGTSTFPENYQRWVNVGVGVANLIVGVAGAIESFLRIPEIIAGAVEASINLQKLAEHINLELSLPRDQRTSNGVIVVKESYAQFEKIFESAPAVLKRVRFVRFRGIGGFGGGSGGFGDSPGAALPPPSDAMLMPDEVATTPMSRDLPADDSPPTALPVVNSVLPMPNSQLGPVSVLSPSRRLPRVEVIIADVGSGGNGNGNEEDYAPPPR